MTDRDDDPRRLLLRQLAQLRGRLDREALDRLLSKIDGWEPYDREPAGEAVRRFLATRVDGGRFQARLREKLKQAKSEA